MKTAQQCPLCSGASTCSGPCDDCGAKIVSDYDDERRRNAKQGQWALCWAHIEAGRFEPQVLAHSPGVFGADDFEDEVFCSAAPADDWQGLWLWEGAADWSGGGGEYPHEVDLLLWGEWRRPTAEDLQVHGLADNHQEKT